MTQTALKFTGPAIGSVLSIVAKSKPEEPKFNARDYMFTSFSDAIAWRESITEDQAAYFAKIDRFIITMIPGNVVEISKKVPDPADLPHFYRCLSYVMLGCNLFGDISFNDDFTKIKLNERYGHEKANSTPT